jgi:hypothetical protein
MTSLTNQLLKYHQYQGQTNDCAPFTIAIVVNAVRNESMLDGWKLAREMNRPRVNWWGPLPTLVVRRIPNWATFPWGIADVLKSHGIKCRWRFAATTDDLHRALNEDRIAMPVVGEIRPLWAHVKPLAAYHPHVGFGFCDPASNGTELAWQSEQEFERLWKNYKHLLIETL